MKNYLASLEEQAKYTNWEEEYTDEDEKRMDVIGQNGNDGEHYNKIELEEEKKKIIEAGVKEIIAGEAKATPANYAKIKVKEIVEKLDDLTKTY